MTLYHFFIPRKEGVFLHFPLIKADYLRHMKIESEKTVAKTRRNNDNKLILDYCTLLSADCMKANKKSIIYSFCLHICMTFFQTRFASLIFFLLLFFPTATSATWLSIVWKSAGEKNNQHDFHSTLVNRRNHTGTRETRNKKNGQERKNMICLHGQCYAVMKHPE